MARMENDGGEDDELQNEAEDIWTSSPDDPNGGLPISTPDERGQLNPAGGQSDHDLNSPSGKQSGEGKEDLKGEPPGQGDKEAGPPRSKFDPPEQCDDNQARPTFKPPEEKPYAQIGHPIPGQPYKTIAEREEIDRQIAEIRTGLFFGAAAFHFTENLEFSKMVNGFVEGVAGPAKGEFTPMGQGQAFPNSQAAQTSPPTPPSSPTPPTK